MPIAETTHDLTTWPGWIKELRARHGWTQEELAERIATSRVTVGRWEIGLSVPRPIYRKVLGYLGKEKRMPPQPKEKQ